MGWNVNTAELANSGRKSIRFFPPNKEKSRGWQAVIQLMAPELFCVHEHVVSPMPGLTFTNREGVRSPRDQETRIACLGSPRVPLGAEMSMPVHNPAGVAECKAIMLPNGQSLHDCPHDSPTARYPARNPWKAFIPVFVHQDTVADAGCYKVIHEFLERPWWLSIIDEVSKYNDDPRSYALQIRAIMSGKTRVFDVQRVPTPAAPPNPTQEPHMEDWQRVQALCSPYRTAESVVQYLGIEQWNPSLAGSAPPVVAPVTSASVNTTPAAAAATPADNWWEQSSTVPASAPPADAPFAAIPGDPFGDDTPTQGTQQRL